MKSNRTLSVSLTKSETVWGFVYLVFELFALPLILPVLNLFLPRPFDLAQINFCYFLINFVAVFGIFHHYLGKNAQQVKAHPAYFCQSVILGLAAYFSLNMAVGSVILLIDPEFANLNDTSIAAMTGDNFFLMALGTVILVPPVEECLFRGLIFRNLYGKSRLAAYAVSTAAFAVIHLINYIPLYTPQDLLLSFLQYIPAGICLGWAYTKADTVFAPILIHALINALGIYAMR